MTSQPRKQTITIFVLPYISKSKGNQTMKFGHLTETKMRKNFFFQKSQRKGRLVLNFFFGF